MTNAQMILDHVDVVKLDISIWTSSKKLRAEDLVLANGSKLPPEDLASLGTKKTINPNRLKEFNRIKKEAERICLESGTRFIGGFANPRIEIPALTQKLDALSRMFYEERDLFLASYAAETDAWINQHAEFGEAIRRAIEPVGTVSSKLRFDYVVFRVAKPDPEQEESLERRACSMSKQLFREIAQEATQIIDRSFIGKDTVTARVLNAFRRIRDKLDSLGFLDHRCMPIVDKIDAVLDSLPKSGAYNGIVFHDLFNLGLLLSDPDKIKRHGGGLLQLPTAIDPDIEEDDPLDDPISSVVEPEDAILVQAPSPDISLADEDSDLGQDLIIETEIDDDLPGFDDFLAKYKPAKDIFDTAPASTHASIDLAMDDIFESENVETDKVTIPVPSPVAEPASSVEDDLDEASDESEETVIAEDYWF